MDVSTLIEVKKNAKIPDIAPGDTVRVSTKIIEGDKERIQVFQGVVIKIKRGGHGASYTVRHVAFGIGVERTFPTSSPLVEKVEIVRQGKVRRSRLYYLRGLSGKEARRKIKRVERKARQVGEELLQAAPEEEIEPIMDEAAVAAAAEKEAAEKAAAAEAAKAEKKAAKKAKKEAPAAEQVAAPVAEKTETPVAEKTEVAEKPKEEAPTSEKKETAEKPAESTEPPKDEKKEEPKA
jgi:large subunit ribosomal protein L19